MAIKARKLKESNIPEKTALYEVLNSRCIAVEEEQKDGSIDRVLLEYLLEDGDIGYFAKEYRPNDVPKTGAKLIDITAVMLNHTRKCIRWHLYDIKGTLAGGKTVVGLLNQWNAGLQYLQKNILEQMPAYAVNPDLGVIARYYDEDRMKRLRDDFRERCNETEHMRQRVTLAQRKRQTEISKDRAIFIAAQAILDREFQAESGSGTYKIHIRHLYCEDGRIFKMRFPV